MNKHQRELQTAKLELGSYRIVYLYTDLYDSNVTHAEQMQSDIESSKKAVENARKNVENLKKELANLSTELRTLEVRDEILPYNLT